MKEPSPSSKQKPADRKQRRPVPQSSDAETSSSSLSVPASTTPGAERVVPSKTQQYLQSKNNKKSKLTTAKEEISVLVGAESNDCSGVLSDKQTWLERRGTSAAPLPGATNVRNGSRVSTGTSGQGGSSSFAGSKGMSIISSRGGGSQRATNHRGPTSEVARALHHKHSNSYSSSNDEIMLGAPLEPVVAVKTSMNRQSKPNFRRQPMVGVDGGDCSDDGDDYNDVTPTIEQEDLEPGWSNFPGDLSMITRSTAGRIAISVQPQQGNDSSPLLDSTSSESISAPNEHFAIMEQANASLDMGDIDGSTNTGLHSLAEATLVDPTEREYEAERIRQETLQEVQSKTVRAQIIDDTAERKRFIRMVAGCACFFAIAIAAAVTTVVALAPKNNDENFQPTRSEAVNAAVEQEFGSDYIYDESSPQYFAIDWIAVNDTLLEFPLETEAERRAFRQRYAMCVLAFSTNIDTWVRETDWLEPVDECSWSGLTCNDNRELVAINTPNRNLTGTLPTELGTLSKLRYMFVYDNPGLEGSIPTEMGNTTSLELFHAQDCSLTGTIPDEFNGLSSLEKLVLAGNTLTGTLPLAMTRLLNANEIDLSRNNFTGLVLPKFWHLQKLQVLLLNDNSFTGSLSPNFGDLGLLERLEIQNNFLTGDLPTQLGNLRALEVLRTYGNSINATRVPNEVCDLRQDLPLPGLQVLEMDCTEPCRCCTSCQGTPN